MPLWQKIGKGNNVKLPHELFKLICNMGSKALQSGRERVEFGVLPTR
jgi:hypothetical protein